MAKNITVKATLEGGTLPAKANLSSGIVRASADIKDVIHETVPGDYVGPDVPRRGPSDMYSAGAFVYAPAGYYEGLSAQSVDISRTLDQPKITVSDTGLITATETISYGAFHEQGLSAERTKQLTQQRGKTVTPTMEEQVAVSAGKFTVGDVKVGPIPPLVPYAIRSDAELIQTYTMDQKAVEDLELTIPAYTTTAQSLKAAENLSPTITVDLDSYRYFVVERFLTIPEYSVTTKGKGRQEYLFCSYMYEVTRLAADELPTIIDPTKVITSAQNLIAANSLYRTLYWSSASAIALYATNAYGCYQTPTSPSLSGSTLTIKSPVLGVRGSTSYFTSTYMNALEDIRYQYVIDVYRAPLDNLNLDGWGQEHALLHLADCINSTGHKLT